MGDGLGLEPDGFTVPAGMVLPTVQLSGSTATVTDKGADYLRPTGKKYYVATDGSDSNDGLTAETPLETWQAAADKSDVDEIIVAPGLYNYLAAIGTPPVRDISIICEAGTATLCRYRTRTWTVDATYTNSYRASQTVVNAVCDLDHLNEYGIPVRYAQKDTEAEVDAAPGSWWTDGTTVLVRPRADSSVGDNIAAIFGNGYNVYFRDTSLYMENINVLGGTVGGYCLNQAAAGRLRFGAKGCCFAYSESNGFATKGGVESVAEACVFYGNVLDGANYHDFTTGIPSAVEINCTGDSNGGDGALPHSNNGSTMHDGGTVVRVACEFFENWGANVADVDTSQSWNIVCSSSSSQGGVDDDYDWEIDGNMWCDACGGAKFNRYNDLSDNLYVTADMTPDITPDGYFTRKTL
jgi:hypothetical protein